MNKRKIIKIEQDKCNGCGLCIPNCPEGALQVIDGKARLISDLFCDGLGACIGHCPEGAITIEEREAGEYEEAKVMENVVKQGSNVIKAHLLHLKEHNQQDYLKQAINFLNQKKIAVPDLESMQHKHTHLPVDHKDTPGASGCPSLKVMDYRGEQKPIKQDKPVSGGISQLRQWPVQIKLIPVFAPYLKDADLLIAADCVPFAYADFYQQLLRDKILLVGCPKLDDIKLYQNKITQILKQNNIKSITCAHMEVPCCFGLVNMVKQAISASGKDIPLDEITISIKGERLK
ncbi:MAG: 4Fe-4S binding protein [Candidatus Omnitrophota bacterium]|jgi:ferredoxin